MLPRAPALVDTRDLDPCRTHLWQGTQGSSRVSGLDRSEEEAIEGVEGGGGEDVGDDDGFVVSCL
jgi:hypothetical protein